MGIGIKELLIILVLVLIVFGTKRLKNAGGDLGEAIKGFRKAMREGEDETKLEDASKAAEQDVAKEKENAQ